MSRRMLSFLLAQASLGGGMPGGVGRRLPDGGEPDGSLNRMRETYRSIPPDQGYELLGDAHDAPIAKGLGDGSVLVVGRDGRHLMEVTKVELDRARVIVRGKRMLANPIEAERFAKAEAKRARKAARRG